MANLTAAYELFRRGHFAEARSAALSLIDQNSEDFWAYYLAAVSSAFLAELKDFEMYLGLLESLAPDFASAAEMPSRAEARRALSGNVYLHYLKAYYALLQNDVEKALWHYLEIADGAEGWLARSHIKKFRKTKELKNIGFRVADFIVLPGELPPKPPIPEILPGGAPPASRAAQPVGDKPGWQFGKSSLGVRRVRLNLASFSLLRLMTAVTISFVLFALFMFWQGRAGKSNVAAMPDLQVADSAAVMPVPDAAKILYRYKTREGIIADFDRAKELLKANKVNQARYLLQRLVHSNADFQTREKSRTFIGFIADPDFAAFNDNLRMKNLFEDIRLRRDSLVVIGGELRDVFAEGNGSLYQFIATENGEEFRVHVYRSESVKEETKATLSGSKTVQVYGRFKGLVGAQQAIYVEALRVWR